MAELTVDMTYGTALYEAAGAGEDGADRDEADEVLALRRGTGPAQVHQLSGHICRREERSPAEMFLRAGSAKNF